MSAPLSRRGFVSVGVVLAAGGLAVPARLLAASPMPHAPASSASDIAARIRSILDRPNPQWYGTTGDDCDCARCSALRRQPRECPACGYEGSFVVTACECRAVRASSITLARQRLAAMNAGAIAGDDGPYWREVLEAAERSPDAICLASPDHDTRMRRHPYCAHGMISCPTCGYYGDGHGMDDPDALLATFRELRAVLRAAGGRP